MTERPYIPRVSAATAAPRYPTSTGAQLKIRSTASSWASCCC